MWVKRTGSTITKNSTLTIGTKSILNMSAKFVARYLKLPDSGPIITSNVKRVESNLNITEMVINLRV